MGRRVDQGCYVIPADAELERRKRRRSRRIRARIRVAVRLQTPDKETISEETDALIVNAHGGLVLLGATVSEDQFLTVVNSQTGEELLARVTDVGLRFMGKAQIGIEFIRPAPDFWGLSPRPKDWKSAATLPPRRAVPEKA
jgi:hypothetical protein